MNKFPLVLLLWTSSVFAEPFTPRGDWHVLEIRKFSMDAWRTTDHRDSYMQYDDPDSPDRKEYWVGGAAANFNLDLMRYGSYGLYWDNSVPMYGTNAQVRQVGWRWEAGLQMGEHLKLWHRHDSEHVLDATRSERFPLTNNYGVTVIFLGGAS